MDESWRMRMGMPNLPRRKSTEETSSHRIRQSLSGESAESINNDFNDVFGGPPRTVLLSRQLSGEFGRSTSFYEEIFRPPEPTLTPSKSGRNLPAFKIPAKRESNSSSRGFKRTEGFYSDIFGSDDDVRFPAKSRSSSKSKSKSKSNSSSVLSSEELSPLRPVTGEDVALSMFSSKLRPINVPYRWNSSTAAMPAECPNQQSGMPAFPPCNPSFVKDHYMENSYNESLCTSYFGFSRQVTSPESISFEPNSYRSIKLSGDDIEINSPSSAVSSVCQEFPEAKVNKTEDSVMEERDVEEEEEEDDEVMSSYVIEINTDHREGNGEANSIDEAIAWAKERYQPQCSDNKQSSEMEGRPSVHQFSSQEVNGHEATQSSTEEETMKCTIELESQRSEKDKEEVEMELLDEDIRLWSTGNETNIRLLLSTLHHILWPNSGWCVIPIVNLIEAAYVKKAYQKARLCLHPDKLQQRGATFPQKYVAEKVFSILQDAWAAFISQDVFL